MPAIQYLTAGPGLFDPGTVLSAWSVDPAIVVPLFVVGSLYLAGVRRANRARKGSAFPRPRTICFMAGLVTLYVALQSPIDAYAGLLFSVHMAQHLMLTMIAAPLLLLGSPVTLALQAVTRDTRRRLIVPVLHARPVRGLASPFLGWVIFAAVMWASHARPIFEAALTSDTIHAVEHLAYLVAALLFWLPVVGLDPVSTRLSHPGRLLYLFLAMPVTSILGLAVYNSSRVLYPSYASIGGAIGVSPLADQHLAGAIMWEGGMLLVLPALAYVLLDWMRRDEREAARMDDRAARARSSIPLKE